jgi:adenine-specific DNA methylase
LVLDPTAGGGSIPFEAERLSLPTISNDINPVASLILNATVDWPIRFGPHILEDFERLSTEFRSRLESQLSDTYPQSKHDDEVDQTYLWTHTVSCPYCEGIIPLSPNWRLASGGIGAKIISHIGNGPGSKGRHCTFEIVNSTEKQSVGTVSRGDAVCPFPDCERVVDGDEIKRAARDGNLGEQLFTIVCKRKVITETAAGNTREKWVRDYRAPTPEDDVSPLIAELLAEKLSEWEALDIIPNELVPDDINDTRPIQ